MMMQYNIEQDECLGYSKTKIVSAEQAQNERDLMKNMLNSFRGFGESIEFKSFASRAGLHEPQFCFREPTIELTQRFHDSLIKECLFTTPGTGPVSNGPTFEGAPSSAFGDPAPAHGGSFTFGTTLAYGSPAPAPGGFGSYGVNIQPPAQARPPAPPVQPLPPVQAPQPPVPPPPPPQPAAFAFGQPSQPLSTPGILFGSTFVPSPGEECEGLQLSTSSTTKNMHPCLSYCTVGLAFHGTREQNIERILKNGLDPAKRWGQAYGQGEYFCKEPSMPTSFCGGGNKMLVFLVIIPTVNICRDKPKDYVVVANNHHQLPIGYIKFKSVEPTILHRSSAQRNQLRALNLEAEKMEKKSEEAKLKANIIQLIIQNEVELASHKYQKYCGGLLTEQSRSEIVIFAMDRCGLDWEFCTYYFPGVDHDDLTGTKQEAILRGIQSVEHQESLAIQARNKVKEEENKLDSFGGPESSPNPFS